MAKFSLDGKVAVVTDGESGLGAAVAAELARRGAALVVQYHASFAAAKRLVRDIEREGGQAIAVKADLEDPAQAEMLCLRAGGALGQIDIMVINTTARAGALVPSSPDEAADAVRRRLFACLAPAYAALRGMSERGAGALIYLTDRDDRELGHAAVVTAMPYLATELSPSRVRVNTVVTGAARPAPAGGAADDGVARPRPARPQDVANAVAMLASDDLEHVTGLTVTVGDGGHIA